MLHALACAQIERHIGPARVVDVGFQRYKRFRHAVGWHVFFSQVAHGSNAFYGATFVLPPNGVAFDVYIGHGAKRAQHLQFFVSYVVGLQRNGRLHSHNTEQL